MTARAPDTRCANCGQEYAADALFCPACGTAKSRDFSGDPLLGTVLGERFLVLDRIGHGASGTIYRGEHVTLRRKVAVKVLHQELSRDDLAMERFRREATTVSAIDNEHIVEIYDFGRTRDGRLYLAMELLEGETLQAILRREKRLPVDLAVDILIQLGEALMEAHAMGYIHRDLRPRNIYLASRRTRRNFVKLLDFGLAKLVEADGASPEITSLGMTFGDPKYMSPEQARGDAVDRRADIYSLGCIAYEMITGQAPFGSGKVFDILSQQVGSLPEAPRSRRGEMPIWLDAAVMSMLAKRPEDRFPTVYQLVEVLRHGLSTGEILPVSATSPEPDSLTSLRPEIPVPSAPAASAASSRTPDRANDEESDFPGDAGTDTIVEPSADEHGPRSTQLGIVAPTRTSAAQARAERKPEAPAPAPEAARPVEARAAVPRPVEAPPAAVKKAAKPVEASPEPKPAARPVEARPEPKPAARPVEVAPAAAKPAAKAAGSQPAGSAKPADSMPAMTGLAVAAAATTGSGKRRAAALIVSDASEDSHAGISAAWFADGDLPQGGKLDDAFEERLTRARASHLPSATDHGAGDDPYQDGDRVSKRMLLIGGGVIGVFALVITVALAWPSSDSKQESVTDATTDRDKAISTAVAAMNTGDAGPAASKTDADPAAGDSATATSDAGQEVASPPNPLPPTPAVRDAGATSTDEPRPTSEKPATGKPTTGKPATGKPTTGKPTTGKPTTGKPATGKPGSGEELQDPFAEPTEKDPNDLVDPFGDSKPDSSNPDLSGVLSAGQDDKKKQAAALAEAGQQALGKNDLGGAASSFKKALDLDPRNADAVIGQGEVAMRTGAYAAAITHLKKAAKLRPRSASVHISLGEAYLNSGNKKQAAQSFKKALQIDPKNSRAQNGFNEATGVNILE